MIIDGHAHLWEKREAFPDVFVNSLCRIWESREGKEGMERHLATLDHGTVEDLINDMDEAGVDKAVVSPVDFGILCEEEPRIPILRQNEYVAESQEKYPDRIIGFVGVEALRNTAIEILEKGVTEWGLKGVKIFTTRYKATDERIQPFLEKVNELEFPVLFHQGIGPLPFLMQYGNPADLDVLALRYPKMKIIAAHVARGWDDFLTEMLTYRVGRIYTDLSAKQPLFLSSPWRFIMQMRYLMDRIPNSVLMGTDWPTLTSSPLPTYKEWFDIIRNLKIPEQVLQLGLGIKDFSQHEKDLILGENAKHLLGIE